MKKKLAVVLAACLCVGVLAACGGSSDKKVDGGNTSGGSNESAGGYTFEASGATIEIDADFSKVVDKLPSVEPFESPSCAFGDMDKVWTYSGFEIDTYQTEGVDYVSAVVLKDDTVSTPEGVSIGDSSDKVTEKYGDASKSEATQMVYEKGGMKLTFLLKDGSVSQIQYSTTKF